MLRDVRYAVIVAAMTTALYTFALSLSPLSFDFGTRAWDMVVLLGIMWMALGFLTGLLCSRFDGRIDDCVAETEAGGGEIDEHAVAKARRLATCPQGANAGTEVRAEVIPFRRLRSSRYPDRNLAGRRALN